MQDLEALADDTHKDLNKAEEEEKKHKPLPTAESVLSDPVKLSNGHHTEVESTALPSEVLSTPVKAPPSPDKDELYEVNQSTAKSS